MVSNVKYPQFRKYKNNKSYFKIISKNEFEEIKQESNTLKIYFFEVKILPDRNFIHDMTFDYENHWENITESEFDELKKLLV